MLTSNYLAVFFEKFTKSVDRFLHFLITTHGNECSHVNMLHLLAELLLANAYASLVLYSIMIEEMISKI